MSRHLSTEPPDAYQRHIEGMSQHAIAACQEPYDSSKRATGPAHREDDDDEPSRDDQLSTLAEQYGDRDRDERGVA